MSSGIAQCLLGDRRLLCAEYRLQPPSCDFSRKSNCLRRGSSDLIMYPSSMSTFSLKGSCRQLTALPFGGDVYFEKAPTPILDLVHSPMHLKNLSAEELKQLADEIRYEMNFLMATSKVPLKSSFSVVELTIAIHRVLNTPVDKVIRDIGEQTYVHKILTGRRSRMHTLKKKGGLSGFTSRFESEYDPFAAGHGSSSVSAALGMAVARDLQGWKNRVLAVIGNWSTMSGQVYEAMAHAGYLDTNMIVVLNDTRHSLNAKLEKSSTVPINALSSTLTKLQSSKSFRKLREAAKGVTKRIGKGMHEIAAKVDQYARGMMVPRGATLFEELGLYYIGPVDGHNIDDLLCVLQEVASLDSTGPVLIHVVTEEQKGVDDTIEMDEQGTLNNSLLTSSPELVDSNNWQTYNDCFTEALIAEADKDDAIVAVYAGMGINQIIHHFESQFPFRSFDLGLGEQHAVTFASGLCCGGLKPFCIIPSTFLQKAYSQIIQDVDLQKQPVRFIITSAGLVGGDGPPRSGAFDITSMSCLPNMVVMSPASIDELADMVATAACINDRPVCLRYPRGAIVGADTQRKGTPLEIGKGEVIVEGRYVALLGYGVMVQNCMKAKCLLSALGFHVTVVNARFCKPLDIELIRKLCREHDFLITVEEGTVGGFGSHVSQFLSLDGWLDRGIKWRPIVLPDNYVEHATIKEQFEIDGLSGHHIAATALSLLGHDREALQLLL